MTNTYHAYKYIINIIPDQETIGSSVNGNIIMLPLT